MKTKTEIFINDQKLGEVEGMNMIHSLEVYKEGEHPEVLVEGVIKEFVVAIGKNPSLWPVRDGWKGIILRTTHK